MRDKLVQTGLQNGNQTTKTGRERKEEEQRGGRVDSLSGCQPVASPSTAVILSVSVGLVMMSESDAKELGLCGCVLFVWYQISRQQQWYAGSTLCCRICTE